MMLGVRITKCTSARAGNGTFSRLLLCSPTLTHRPVQLLPEKVFPTKIIFFKRSQSLPHFVILNTSILLSKASGQQNSKLTKAEIQSCLASLQLMVACRARTFKCWLKPERKVLYVY